MAKVEFKEGRHSQVLVIGYSCSDVFDLSPQIVTLADNLKQVFLVSHSGSPKIENIRKQEQKNPFKVFVDSTRLFIVTRDLVERLWKPTLGEAYPYASNIDKSLRVNPDWKAMVHDWYANSINTQSSDFGKYPGLSI